MQFLKPGGGHEATGIYRSCGRRRGSVAAGMAKKRLQHALPGLGVRVEPDQCRSRDEAGFFAIASSMETAPAMKPLLKQIQHTPLLWMLIFVPTVLVPEAVAPQSHTLLFVLSVIAIVPLAALLSHATEVGAAKTDAALGG